MNSFEINKIITAIIITILIVIVINKTSDFIFNLEDESVVAYKVEAPEGSVMKVKSEQTVDLASLFLEADISHGEKVFKKCSACHVVEKGGANKIGPALYGVLGRKVGAINDYKYSQALMGYGKEWTFEEMNGYLKKPQAWIKGTKMSFAGLRKEKDRASVILYLNQYSDNPLPLP